MRILKQGAIALGLAAALSMAAATPSSARTRHHHMSYVRTHAMGAYAMAGPMIRVNRRAGHSCIPSGVGIPQYC